jgi:hypothetical protein
VDVRSVAVCGIPIQYMRVHTGKKEIYRRAGCSLCRAGTFSWSLEEKYKTYFVLKNKTWVWIGIQIQQKALDPDLSPDSSNPDSGPYPIQ